MTVDARKKFDAELARAAAIPMPIGYRRPDAATVVMPDGKKQKTPPSWWRGEDVAAQDAMAVIAWMEKGKGED